jgi:DNA helicase-2/ATP-dependent DNA helicase PcrA
VIEELLKDFKLSISALNTYLRCPLSFYYEKVLKVPSVTSEAAAYGLAIHYALMMLFEKMKRSESNKYPALKSFLSYFNQELKRNRGSFTKLEYDRRLELGRLNLSRIYTDFLPHWHKNILTEIPIKKVAVADVPLTGTIDKVEIHKNRVHLVDYKTGSHNPAKIAAPSNTKPDGGPYWRQLVFYKILFESQSTNSLQAQSGEIIYVDPDPAGELAAKSIKITEEDKKLVRKIIVDTYQKIQKHDFFTGCDEPNCIWCNFVKKNLMVDSFSNPATDALDDSN